MTYYIQQLIQSISLCFQCPSTSHDMRGIKWCLSIEFEEDSIQHNPFELNCSIAQLFDSVSFDPTNEDHNSPNDQDDLIVAELKGLIEETLRHRESINQLQRERNMSMTSSLGFGVDIRVAIEEFYILFKRNSILDYGMKAGDW